MVWRTSLRCVLQADAALLQQLRRARAYAPLIDAVAAVIKDNIDLIGAVRVVGHTDSVPVQTAIDTIVGWITSRRNDTPTAALVDPGVAT